MAHMSKILQISSLFALCAHTVSALPNPTQNTSPACTLLPGQAKCVDASHLNTRSIPSFERPHGMKNTWSGIKAPLQKAPNQNKGRIASQARPAPKRTSSSLKPRPVSGGTQARPKNTGSPGRTIGSRVGGQVKKVVAGYAGASAQNRGRTQSRPGSTPRKTTNANRPVSARPKSTNNRAPSQTRKSTSRGPSSSKPAQKARTPSQSRIRPLPITKNAPRPGVRASASGSSRSSSRAGATQVRKNSANGQAPKSMSRSSSRAGATQVRKNSANGRAPKSMPKVQPRPKMANPPRAKA